MLHYLFSHLLPVYYSCLLFKIKALYVQQWFVAYQESRVAALP